MSEKQCFKCGEVKSLDNFYKHKQMGDGHVNKCIECTLKDVRERELKLKEDPEWVDRERARHREKYHRLEYKEKHRPSPDKKKEVMHTYRVKYPEKYTAKILSQRIPVFEGAERHHWSYRKEDAKNVIQLNAKEHAKAHRFIIYDQERLMYRRFDTNELLDTKEKHEEFIRNAIAAYPD